MAGSFAQRLDAVRKLGRVPRIRTAPYYLIVAERRRRCEKFRTV